MSKRATGEWVYEMRHNGHYPIAFRYFKPLGYSQSHWRKIIKERNKRDVALDVALSLALDSFVAKERQRQ